MKFRAYVEGEFESIKGCMLKQRFEVEVECGKCKARKSGIRIDGESIIRKDVGKRDDAKYNFVMKCQCDTEICINVYEPEHTVLVTDKDGENELKISPLEGDKVHIVDFWSTGGIIVSMDNVQLTIVAENLEMFENVDISKHMVAEQGEDVEVVIRDFKLSVIQIK